MGIVTAHIFYEDQGNGYGKINCVERFRVSGDSEKDTVHYSKPHIVVEMDDLPETANTVFFTKRVRLSDMTLVNGGPGYPPTKEEKKQAKLTELQTIKDIEGLKAFIEAYLI